MTTDEELERLRAEVEAATRQRDELLNGCQAALRANELLEERTTLKPAERLALAGHDDGCIRVEEIRPLVVRVWGQEEWDKIKRLGRAC